MAIRKLESMKRQRGQALILVLIALALGSLLITPTLNYAYTGLRETRVSQEQLLEQYAADAAVEYSLWVLKYNVDGLTGQLGTENPSSNTSVTVNGMEVLVTTEISYSIQSDNGSFEIPGTVSGIHIAVAQTIASPVWCKTGQQGYIAHVVYIYNYGTSAVHLKGLFQQLDPDLTYLERSYDGPDADLTKTRVDDHGELYFNFTEPLPKLNAQDAMVITFTAWTLKHMGEDTFSSSGWVDYAAFAEEAKECYSGDSGVASFGLYDISVTVGSYTILANVGITEEGEVVIRSWQVE